MSTDRRPTKSGLVRFIAQSRPTSLGCVMPSVSWLTIMWPFSRRSSRCASTPKGRIPQGAPAVASNDQSCSANKLGTCSSYPNSPTKPTRIIRTGTPLISPTRQPKYGNPSALRSTDPGSVSNTLRDSGPAILIAENAAVTLATSTCRRHCAFQRNIS